MNALLVDGAEHPEVDEADGPAADVLLPEATFDPHEVLASIDSMAAQRPVAAQIVALTHADDAGAKELARLLAADVALTGRVFKLANSAYYGLSGRVSSLQFAVTVVGFSTVRSMASVALTSTDQTNLPPEHWTTSTHLALAASALAPRMGHRAADALCVGLLAQLGAALLHHHDPEGYGELTTEHTAAAARRAAEVERYGVHAVELTAAAMRQWGFPAAMISPLAQLQDDTSVDGGLLRGAFEVTERLTAKGHRPVPIHRLTCERIREVDVVPVLTHVRTEAADLRRVLQS
ncbi:HDOD domain-containing protein [Klenkia soli]|uniref:HDOD domain-containing protein n=1 Tax=Klenkia soli TaxID=1052260 RepID=A0A1H0RWE5_9ACTN|nr:HDOD domain-containing protein [Klenkia soli]SDP33901.1 HDOD domain-containing protein [Klenkia soli]